MLATSETSQRHPAEAEMLARAVAGDPEAVNTMLRQLSSPNQWLRRIILEAIQDTADLILWQRLLACWALHQWRVRDVEEPGFPRWIMRETTEAIEPALTGLFVEDDRPEIVPLKLAVLHEGLTDPNCRIRNASATLLGLRGDGRAIDTLIEAVRSGEPECRLRATRALGALKDPRGGWVLVEALASDDEPLHHKATEALSAMGDKAIPALVEALKHPRQHVRWHAVRALGEIGAACVAANLADTLDDADYGVRWAAAEVLSGLGSEAVRAILERLSSHALSEGMRQAAYHSLHQLQRGELQTRLQPLLDALHGPGAIAEAPMVAFRLLQAWKTSEE